MTAAERPLVSVIMPCHNAATTVGETLAALQAQTLTQWELLAIDDGSTDGSAAGTWELLAACDDPRLRPVHQPNRGPGAARNLAVLLARSGLLAFQDADDISLPQRLEYQVTALARQPEIQVIASGYTWIDEAGIAIPWRQPWEGWPSLDGLAPWLQSCPLVPSATMMRRSAYLAVGGMETDLLGGEDWNLWMKLAVAGYRFAWEPQVVCHYRVRRASLSNQATSMARDCPVALQRILDDPRFPRELVGAGRSALALRYLDSVKRLFTARDWAAAEAALAEALRLEPSLAGGRPSRLEDELVMAALAPLVDDPPRLIEQMLRHLPAAIGQTLSPEHLRWRLGIEALALGRELPGSRRSWAAQALLLPARLFDSASRAFVRRALSNCLRSAKRTKRAPR
jgi:glycosyltransferase involved in cell wall biosynthesis